MEHNTITVPPPIDRNQDSDKAQFVIRARIRGSGKINDYSSNRLNLRVGDLCIVEGEHGPEFAIITMSKWCMALKKCRKKRLKKLIRKAGKEDAEQLQKNEDLEKEAYKFCQDRIKDLAISMKLYRVEFDFYAEKATFYFSSEDRVDFRDLVKDLAHQFKIKIEMWQVGVRDEARITGGCGICGRGLCCTTFLKDFEPVSIKMAKDQNLALNPLKISGACGRLMCCLGYEHKTYQSLKRGLPKIGRIIETPEGKGRVTQVNTLAETVKVELEEDRKIILLSAFDIPKEALETPKESSRGGYNRQHKKRKRHSSKNGCDNKTHPNNKKPLRGSSRAPDSNRIQKGKNKESKIGKD